MSQELRLLVAGSPAQALGVAVPEETEHLQCAGQWAPLPATPSVGEGVGVHSVTESSLADTVRLQPGQVVVAKPHLSQVTAVVQSPPPSAEDDEEEGADGENARPVAAAASLRSPPPLPRELSTGIPVLSVACGAEHSLLLSGSGSVFSWGSNEHGQLGRTGGQGKPERRPARVMALEALPEAGRVIGISAGARHSLAWLDESGLLCTWGANESGQLGLGDFLPRARPTVVADLSAKSSAFRSSGSDARKGLQRNAARTTQVVSAVAGGAHTLVLTLHSEVFVAGKNTEGQLGLGDTEQRRWFSPVSALWGKPVVGIAAGADHSVAWTASGTVVAFGSNRSGQIGFSPLRAGSFPSPTVVPEAADRGVIAVSCGRSHNLALCASGTLLSWGSNTEGECGQVATAKSATVAVGEVELQGGRTAAFAAGSQYSLAVATPPGDTVPELRGWGKSTVGQLGLLSRQETREARRVFAGGKTETDADGWEPLSVVAGPTSSHSFLVTQRSTGTGDPLEFLQSAARGLPAFLSLPGIRQLEKAGDDARLREWILTCFTSPGSLAASFARKPTRSDLCVVCDHDCGLDFAAVRSFYTLLLGRDPERKFVSTLTVATTAALASLSHTLDAGAHAITDTFTMATSARRGSGSGVTFLPETIRSVFIILENPLLLRASKETIPVVERLVQLLQHIMTHVPGAAKYVRSWWRTMPRAFFNRHVRIFKSFLTTCLTLGIESTHVVSVCNLLHEAFVVNNQGSSVPLMVPLHQCAHNTITDVDKAIAGHVETRIPNDLFNSPEVSRVFESNKQDDIDSAIREYVTFCTSPNVFSFLSFPFLLTPAAKSKLFKIDAQVEMQQSVMQARLSAELQTQQEHIAESIQQGVLPLNLLLHYQEQLELSSHTSFVVHRETLLEDTRAQLLGMLETARQHSSGGPVSVAILKRPLQVTFVGEDGQDFGGVQREFFQLVLQELLAEEDIFVADPQTNLAWFKPGQDTPEAIEKYMVAGMLLGLALFNSVIVGDGAVRFAPVLFKRLLASNHAALSKPRLTATANTFRAPSMQDLEATHPEAALGFQRLLEHDGDVEEDFGVFWSVSTPGSGHSKMTELISGGSEIPVTNENRVAFVQAYTNFLLTTSVEKSYQAFAEGFLAVVGGDVLDSCTWSELELLLFGQDLLPDIQDLRRHTTYKGGFSDTHHTVESFWKVVEQMPAPEQRELLAFATGSGRVPVQGMSALGFVLQRNGDDQDQLPTSFTCARVLLLPEYHTESQLREKLSIALKMGGKGFGMS